jgi:PEP-CTERM motif
MASSLAAATCASGATITQGLAGDPFSGLSSIGGFPVMALSKTNTYDFTFAMGSPLVGDTQTQFQAQIIGGKAELISFDLYSGTPTGSHAFIAASPVAYSSVLSEDLKAGDYYVQITPTQIAANDEVVSGSLIVATVPEPASWALMILGIGAAGGALRRRSGAVCRPAGA